MNAISHYPTLQVKKNSRSFWYCTREHSHFSIRKWSFTLTLKCFIKIINIQVILNHLITWRKASSTKKLCFQGSELYRYNGENHFQFLLFFAIILFVKKAICCGRVRSCEPHWTRNSNGRPPGVQEEPVCAQGISGGSFKKQYKGPWSGERRDLLLHGQKVYDWKSDRGSFGESSSVSSRLCRGGCRIKFFFRDDQCRGSLFLFLPSLSRSSSKGGKVRGKPNPSDSSSRLTC